MRKTLFTLLIITFSSVFFASCEVQSDDGGKAGSTNEETNMELGQNISIFVDGKEQKGDITTNDGIKIDLNKIKEDSGVIAQVNGEDDCASNKVNYKEEVLNGTTTKPKTLDVTLDLTRFGKGDEMEKLTQNRINQLQSLIEGDLYEGVKMNEGDSMILRFIGTIDYGENGKNIPLNDRIVFNMKAKSGKIIKISDIECTKNERKKVIYLKLAQKNITTEENTNNIDSKSNNTKSEKIKDELNSTEKFEVSDTKELTILATKIFEDRYSSNKYSQGTYIIEFMDQSDILNSKQENVDTYVFTDANFQLHPNFLKNYTNPYKVKVGELWDFTPETYNKDAQAFSSFYRYLITDPYFVSLKEKCKTNNNLTLVGTKNGTNKYFDRILENFYTKILPTCKINFN